MIIIADKEAQQAIGNLCDLALKVGGMNNLDSVKKLLDAVNPLEEKQEKEPDDGK